MHETSPFTSGPGARPPGSRTCSPWQRATGYWQTRSVHAKFLAVYLLLLTVPVAVISWFAYTRYKAAVEGQFVRYAGAVTSQVNRNIEYNLWEMDRISLQPSLDEEAVAYLGSDLTTEADRLLARRKLHDILINLRMLRPDISAILIFGNHEVFYVSPNQFLRGDYRPVNEGWYKAARQGRGRRILISTHAQDRSYGDGRLVFSLAREVFNLRDNSLVSLGVILIDADFSIIRQLCTNIRLGRTGKVMVVDQAGRIVYDPAEERIGKLVEAEYRGIISRERSGSFFVRSGGRRMLITVDTSDYSGWKVLGIVPVAELTAELVPVQLASLIVAAICLILAAAASAFFAYGITRPIRSLRSLMRRVEQGDFGVEMPQLPRDEIGELGHGFNLMVGQLGQLVQHEAELVQREYDARLRQKEAELGALQSQINPHFLYNTLDSVRMMALAGRAAEVARVLTALAKLFRASVSRGRTIVPLGQEIEHLRYYLDIQGARYGERFTVEIDIPEELLPYQTVKMLLQPLVENAIVHGLEPKTGGGRVEVEGRLAGESVYVTVRDNGVGMDDARLAQVRKWLAGGEQPSDRQGIGLRNVHERIKLYFGEEYGLSVESAPGSGTSVSARMPARREV